MNVRVATLLTLCALTAACGGETPNTEPAAGAAGERPPEVHTTEEAVRRDASTDLSKVPLSAADYRLYANIMGGASALGLTLSPEDRELLQWLKRVDAGAVKPSAADAPRLAKARALQNKDDELARLQGIDARYSEVKSRIEALIGPAARPPAPDDRLATENLRFLEAHREEIQRLQAKVRDPLSREAVARE